MIFSKFILVIAIACIPCIVPTQFENWFNAFEQFHFYSSEFFIVFFCPLFFIEIFRFKYWMNTIFALNSTIFFLNHNYRKVNHLQNNGLRWWLIHSCTIYEVYSYIDGSTIIYTVYTFTIFSQYANYCKIIFKSWLKAFGDSMLRNS